MDRSVCVFSEWCTGYMFVCFLLLLQFKMWLVRPVVHKSSIRLGLHPPYLSVRFSPVSMNNLSDTKHKGSPLYFSIFRFSIFFSSLLPSLSYPFATLYSPLLDIFWAEIYLPLTCICLLILPLGKGKTSALFQMKVFSDLNSDWHSVIMSRYFCLSIYFSLVHSSDI